MDNWYLAPTADIYLKFDSDGSVQQSGFELSVIKFGKIVTMFFLNISVENR